MDTRTLTRRLALPLFVAASLLMASGCATLKSTFNPATSQDAYAIKTPAKPAAKKPTGALASKSSSHKTSPTKKATRAVDTNTTVVDGLNLGNADQSDRDLMELGAWERGYSMDNAH